MNKKIIGLIFGVILIISSVLLFTIFTDTLIDISGDKNEEGTTSDILDEIDDNLLEEDDEIEIGEMV